MNYTDTQLKQALAKMLPEQIEFELGKLLWLEPIGPKGASFQVFVSDTELLHICWLVEKTLGELWPVYYAQFVEFEGVTINASWQQRTTALAKVKGVEIV